MLAVTKGDELGGGVDELVLERLALLLPRAREAERVERVRVGVHRVVEVHRVRRGGDKRARGDERAVGEGDVLEDLAMERNCGDGR